MRRGFRAGVEAGVIAGLVAVIAVVVVPSLRAGDEVPAASAGGPLLADPAVTATATTPFEDGGLRAPLDVITIDTATDVTTGTASVVADGAGPVTIDVVAPATIRTWRGVGAALTDSSVELLAGNAEALSLLFDPSRPDGAGLDLVRLPLSATDFSMRDWTWSIDRRTGSTVVEPSAEARDALAVLDEITALRSDVSVVAASWSAPSSMRTEPSEPGGALTATGEYGQLLAAQADWLLAHGVPVSALSLGNEPGHVGDYPTLAMTDAQMIELSERLGPDLDRVGIDLLALDHNWSDAGRVANLTRAGDFDAVAFHCYDGQPEAMAAIDVPVLITECTATTGGWHESVGWMARELVGDAIASGSTGLVMWNLALDPAHGPKRSGGCADCRGLVTVDPGAGTVEPTPELAVLSHLSAAADPGATILDAERVDGVPVAAFVNPDGSVGVFGHNDSPEPLSLTLRLDLPDVGARSIRIDVPSWAVFSVREA